MLYYNILCKYNGAVYHLFPEDAMYQELSLLYPPECADASSHHAGLPASVADQLELSSLLELKNSSVGDFFTGDPETIIYRQETMRDIAENPPLTLLLEKAYPILSDITELRRLGSDAGGDDVYSYLYNLTEAELYTSLMELLYTGLTPLRETIRSRAFTAFVDRIAELFDSEYYKKLNERLNSLSSRVRDIKSVTIGVNLDARLKPEGAGVLSINSERFKSGEVMDKLLRLSFKSDEMTCIAAMTPFGKSNNESQQMALTNAFLGAINDVFKSSVRSWRRLIENYVLANTDFLIRMMPEFEFIIRASALIARLTERGCPLVYPDILPCKDKKFNAKGLWNPVIALKVAGEMIPNDLCFDEDGMIYVLTGPNRGGKSVLTCAVGLAFAMAQLGLPVTAESCVLSPCDTIFTHFPTGSEDTVEKGRLGEECARLEAIFDSVTGQSLVLLDEALSSTGAFEASYIASEILTGFSIAKCRCIFSTHLHDLAAAVDSINADCMERGGVKIDNLVAVMSDGDRSFRIMRKTPDGKSYARDIAAKYGLSSDKLLEKLRSRKDTE